MEKEEFIKMGRGMGKSYPTPPIEEDNDFFKTFCPICGGQAVPTGNCSLRCLDCKQVTRAGCGE